jgi:hypothetical protein
MSGLESKLEQLANKLDTFSDRLFTLSLEQQRVTGDMRTELTSLSHCFSANNQDIEHLRHAVFDHKDGLRDRVLKIEHTLADVTERAKRQQALLWTVLAGVAVSLATMLLGKLL